jgi:hypothetical protein
LLLGASVSIGFSESAQSADVGDDTAKAAALTLPNIYLDMRTTYTSTPGGTRSIGFSNPSLSSAVATIQSLEALANSPALPARPSLSRQAAAVDVPLTVDLGDPAHWNVGFQADLYKQKGGRSQVVPASNRSAARSLYT